MTLLSDLATEATTKDGNNGWQRQSVKSLPELRDSDLLKPFKKAYMTDSSVTIKDTKTRRVIGERVTNGELGRLYLKRVMTNGAEAGNATLLRRVPYRREAMQFMDRGPAYYFAGECGGPFTLVDIKACYATLYTRLTLNVIYRPECNPPLFGLGRGQFPQVGEWLETKGPRNALWGTVLNPTGPEWRHGEFTPNAYPNRFFAPDLRGMVYDAAHAIAREATTRFGALSWAVDGGAFRPEEAREFIDWLDTAWGLTAEVRAEGPGWMFGATSYSIGPVTTEDVRKGKAMQWSEMDGLRRDVKSQWLAGVFQERAA